MNKKLELILLFLFLFTPIESRCTPDLIEDYDTIIWGKNDPAQTKEEFRDLKKYSDAISPLATTTDPLNEESGYPIYHLNPCPSIDVLVSPQEFFNKGHFNYIFRAVDLLSFEEKAIHVPYRSTAFSQECEFLKDMGPTPGIPQTITYCEDGLIKWTLQDLYQGDLLNYYDLIAGQKTKRRKALQRLLEVLAKIHHKGWVHKDIKLENILLAQDNTVVLSDFDTITKDRLKLIGTPNKYNPELLSKMNRTNPQYESKKDMQTADIYALGVSVTLLQSKALGIQLDKINHRAALCLYQDQACDESKWKLILEDKEKLLVGWEDYLTLLKILSKDENGNYQLFQPEALAFLMVKYPHKLSANELHQLYHKIPKKRSGIPKDPSAVPLFTP